MSSMTRDDILAAIANRVGSRYADLRGADLRGADLRSARDVPASAAATLLVPPEEGAFIAWKALADGLVARLSVPERAQRSSATSRKCRVSEALVTAIYDSDGNAVKSGVSRHDNSFVYRVGETVTPREPFYTDRWNECASGIHCFITRYEAENYT